MPEKKGISIGRIDLLKGILKEYKKGRIDPSKRKLKPMTRWQAVANSPRLFTLSINRSIIGKKKFKLSSSIS